MMARGVLLCAFLAAYALNGLLGSDEWLLLAQLSQASANDIAAQEVAHAQLSSYSLEMHCWSPQIMIISWTTTVEENVAGYKIHRHSLDGEQDNAWVNPIPLTAHGPGDYRLIDSQMAPGRRYLYRLYVFDDTFQLSRAQQIILANPAQPTCLHLPMTHR